ncbi:MAG: hypothetical protein IJD22_03820 [Clostridia bacterium]|nr:hypothetical protein [Clostridia bacterium]
MDIVSAVRKMCEGEKGFSRLFDKKSSYELLLSLADDKGDAELFCKLIYGKARSALVDLINDAYSYKDNAVSVQEALRTDGLDAAEAHQALEIFYKAFGFPGYREADSTKVSTISDTVGESFRVEYEGEVQNGIEYGVGVRNCYHHGKWCSRDECVWINGVMIGYNSVTEIEFGAFETKKIGFVVEDCFVGNIKCFCGEDEEYDTVTGFKV